MLSFKYLSMAFRKSGKPGQDVYLILFWGRIFWNEPYCVFRFCHGRLYFVSECLNRLIVSEFLDSSCNLVKLLRALNKSLYR